MLQGKSALFFGFCVSFDTSSLAPKGDLGVQCPDSKGDQCKIDGSDDEVASVRCAF